MNEFIEKIIERLEEEKGKIVIDGKEMYQEDYFIDIDDAIEIINELAEEYKEPLTADETQEIRTIMKQMHELFEEAWDLNNYGEGTDLSRMVTTYLPKIEQSYKYFVERAVK